MDELPSDAQRGEGQGFPMPRLVARSSAQLGPGGLPGINPAEEGTLRGWCRSTL